MKPDIVYFNNRRSREYTEDIISTRNKVKWIIFKEKLFYERYSKVKQKKHCKYGFIDFQLEKANLLGVYNFLPIIIFDLLLNGCKKIEISNIDFYLKKNSYISTYRNKKQSIDERMKSLRLHDPLKTFGLMKYLYEKKILIPKKKIKKYFKLSELQYAEKLDKLYVK